jgi:ABC-type branched-subunit amino acid transport system substrate-binding protein
LDNFEEGVMSAAPSPPVQVKPEEYKPEPTPIPRLERLETNAGRRIVSILRKWIVLPLLGALISAVVIGRVVDQLLGPSSYKVYLIGHLSESETAGIASAFSGELPKINGVPVEIKQLDDSGDPDTAERISLHLASLNDTLLVVGHLESTPTQKALPAYLQIAEPPIPVILTTETNPNVLPPKPADGTYYPAFRLSPTDDSQAKKAADFALSQGATAIWVVEDVSNHVYSKYLAHEFVRQVHQHPSAKVLLWSTNYNIPPAYAVSALGINWVFFAGEWQDALVLIRQLRAMPQTHKVNILLSDWCVDGKLIEDGGSDVENVYLTHALSPTVYNQEHYAVYGKDAFQLVKQLLVDGDQQFDQLARKGGNKTAYLLRRVLGLRRVGDARRTLAYLMEASVLQRRAFSLTGGTGEAQAVFNGDGTRIDAAFQVWQIRNHAFSNP